jgi:hypothetical protein
MKFILLLALLFSAVTAFAKADPKYCGKVSSCHVGYIPVFRAGTYYARGFGANCAQAEARGQELFLREFGNMDCGIISGPFLDGWECSRSQSGRAVAWIKCNQDSSVRSSPRPRCAIIGGVMVCNH